LPIQVRDTGLDIKDDVPKSDVNKEYYTQNAEREVCVERLLHPRYFCVHKFNFQCFTPVNPPISLTPFVLR
jgi:hypothetical protein